jgi:hypothetical protein
MELLSSLVNVAPAMAAAAHLGGLDAPLSAAAQKIIDAFLDDLKCKPLGFYTWIDALRRIFQQDRLLQQTLEPADAASLSAALDAVPTAKAAYDEYLGFVARLTNPLAAETRDLRQPGGRWFFPPSRSHEAELIERLYGNRAIPDGFSLADEMVKCIRNGSLRVEPTEASGWYDFQTWALEPLVVPDSMPEGARLRMNDRYREQLAELFKAILSLTRETHVKQLHEPMVGSAMRRRDPDVVVVPELTVEPIPTNYLRRAEGYDFVRHVLDYAGSLTTLRRLTPTGPVTRSLDEELAEMSALFRGAAAVAGEELGLKTATGTEAEHFCAWAKSPDVGQDVRMMVPVFFDIARQKTKVWAILGSATRLLEVSFATPPTAHVVKGRPRVRFASTFRQIAYPVFAETYVARLLDRDEFRAHCDRYKTRSEILQHL